MFKHCYHILRHMTDLEMTNSDLESFVIDTYILEKDTYYKDVQVNLYDLSEAIAGHGQFKEFLEILNSIHVSQISDEAYDEQDDEIDSIIEQRKPDFKDSETVRSKFQGTKPADIRENKAKEHDFDSIQELQSNRHEDAYSIEASDKSKQSPTMNKKDTMSISKLQTVKANRDEEGQAIIAKQMQLEKAQIRIERLKFEIDNKIQTHCREYLKFLHKHFKNIKTKVQDSYLVACVPTIIDSIVFEEDLKTRQVTILSDSLVKVIKKIPRQVFEEDPDLKSNKGKPNQEHKEEPRIVYDEEEDTIVDEKRLQILTCITFRDLFKKKVMVMLMRKQELFQKSLIYTDYDMVKMINIKTKCLLIG